MTAPSGPDNQQQKPDQNQQPVIPNQYAFLWLSAAIFLMVLAWTALTSWLLFLRYPVLPKTVLA